MRDIAFILLTGTFFALAYAYIGGCARILGRDPSGEASVDVEPRSEAAR